jgi:lysophospholipase L1-like esterase
VRAAATAGALSAVLLLALAGCGGTSGEGSDKTVIAALGDSITAGNPGFEPDASIRAQSGFGSDSQSQYEYWAQRKHPDLQIRNCGVFGERTDEIVRRLDECAQGADGIVIQGGINDIAQGLPVEAAAANISGMVRAAKELNLDVAIADLLPWNRGHPQADGAIEQLNRRIAEIGSSEDVAVLPFHQTLEDPNAPGLMKPEWTADGDHPSLEGYRRLGEIAFSPPGS